MTNHETRNEWRPPVGGRYLSSSGRIWTVRSITSRGSRVGMTSDSPVGEHGTVLDVTALSRMIALDAPLVEGPGARLDAGRGRPECSPTAPRGTGKRVEDAPIAQPTGVR
jgi:hypothetical protein